MISTLIFQSDVYISVETEGLTAGRSDLVKLFTLSASSRYNVAVMLYGGKVTVGLVESNDSLLPGLWLISSSSWLSSTGMIFRHQHQTCEY